MAIKFAVCEWSLPLTGPNNCKIASEAGLDGLSLDMGTYELGYPLSNKRVQENYLIEKERWNIEFPSIVINDLCVYNLCAPVGSEDYRITMLVATKCVDTAVSMGIDTIFLPSFLASDIKNEEDFQATARFITDVCDYARDTAVFVCWENVLTWQENLRMMEQVNRTNFRFYFDTQNPHAFHGYDAAEMIQKLGTNIKEVHVKDGFSGQMSVAMLGDGASDFLSSLRALSSIGYDGWLVSENMYFKQPLSDKAADPFTLLDKDIMYLKKQSALLFTK